MNTVPDTKDREQYDAAWPPLPLEAWQDTYDTLHMWTQVVGKVKLELCPYLNEWWEVALHPTARGLTTLPMPIERGALEISFDFVDHNLRLCTSSGEVKVMPLIPRSVADFYHEFMATLRAMGIEVTINTLPDEVEQPIPCDTDHVHASYDPEYANRWWRILIQASKVFARYRSPFFGKSSPVQFFWGSFDLSETRFSGQPAEPPKGANRILRLAEDEQNIAAGFWPGGGKVAGPAFYSYTYPEPAGFKAASVEPSAAHYDADIGEFILMYDDMRRASSPEKTLLEFLQSAYEAGANLAHWDRQRLERPVPDVGKSRRRMG